MSKTEFVSDDDFEFVDDTDFIFMPGPIYLNGTIDSLSVVRTISSLSESRSFVNLSELRTVAGLLENTIANLTPDRNIENV